VRPDSESHSHHHEKEEHSCKEKVGLLYIPMGVYVYT
jgi:hypothetical protein